MSNFLKEFTDIVDKAKKLKSKGFPGLAHPIWKHHTSVPKWASTRSFSKRASGYKMPRSGIVSTVQKDYGSLYSKRRRRFRRKRRFRGRLTARTVRKIARSVVSKSNLGGKHRNLYTALGINSVSQGQQGLLTFVLNGLYGQIDFPTTVAGCRDLYNLHSDLITAGELDTGDMGKFLVHKAVLDLTLHNTGSTSAEMDVYRVFFKNTDVDFTDPGNLINTLNGRTNPTGIGASATIVDLGYSLFSVPGLGRHVKIVKEERVYLEPGKCVTMMLKSNKPYYVNAEEILDVDAGSDFIHKRTMGILVVYRGCPITTATPTNTTDAVQINWHCNRRYITCTAAPQDEYSRFLQVS